MNKDILLVVQSLSNERDVDEGVIFEAIEAALATVAAKRYEEEILARVSIDRISGEYESFRRWVVVENDDAIELPEQEITLEKAHEFDSSLEVGDFVEEVIENPDGRYWSSAG